MKIIQIQVVHRNFGGGMYEDIIYGIGDDMKMYIYNTKIAQWEILVGI